MISHVRRIHHVPHLQQIPASLSIKTCTKIKKNIKLSEIKKSDGTDYHTCCCHPLRESLENKSYADYWKILKNKTSLENNTSSKVNIQFFSEIETRPRSRISGKLKWISLDFIVQDTSDFNIIESHRCCDDRLKWIRKRYGYTVTDRCFVSVYAITQYSTLVG